MQIADSTGIISTVLDTNSISEPRRISADVLGNLYFADSGNHRIRKVDMSGNISTIAGTGDSGYSGDNGLATAAIPLNSPKDIAVASDGSIYIVDSGNHCVRKIDT